MGIPGASACWRSAARLPHYRCPVAINIAVANCRDRPPKIVMVFGIQYSDERVVETKRHDCHEACAVDDTHLLYGHELAYEGVIGDWCTDEPEPGRLGL